MAGNKLAGKCCSGRLWMKLGAMTVSSIFYALRGKELFKEAAGPAGQQARLGEAVLAGELFPARIRQRVRHPQVAAIDIVFDEQ
jgi:hypothetical protein